MGTGQNFGERRLEFRKLPLIEPTKEGMVSRHFEEVAVVLGQSEGAGLCICKRQTLLFVSCGFRMLTF